MKRPYIILISIVFTITLHGFAQMQDDLNKLRLAQAFEQDTEFERAARLYEELLSRDQSNFVYFDGLRRCYVQYKNYEGAISISNRRLQKNPGDLNVLVELGSLYYRAENEAAADSVWSSVIAIAPANSNYYRSVAMAQSELRLFDKTIATYLRGRKTLNEPALFVNELASLYTLMMNYTEAAREYVKLLLQNENQLEFIESRLAQFTGKDEGMSAAFHVVEEAFAARKESIALLRLLIWLSLDSQQYEKAFELARQLEERVNSNGAELFTFAERALREKAYIVASRAYRASLEKLPVMPFVPQAKFGYARAMEELNRTNDTVDVVTPSNPQKYPLETSPGTQGVIGLYLSLASEFPNSEIAAQSMYRVGLIRYKNFFDLDGALAILDSLGKRIPRTSLDVMVTGLAGEIYIAKGDLQNAAERYGRIASISMLAQYKLAQVYFYKHQFDSCTAHLEIIAGTLTSDEANDALLLQQFIIENKGMFASALSDFADAAFLLQQRKISEAAARINLLIGSYPGAPLIDDVLMLKAETSILMKRPYEALSVYQKIITEYLKSIIRDKAQFAMGEVYEKQLKDPLKARQAYEEILSSYKQSLYLEEARRRIRILRGDNL